MKPREVVQEKTDEVVPAGGAPAAAPVVVPPADAPAPASQPAPAPAESSVDFSAIASSDLTDDDAGVPVVEAPKPAASKPDVPPKPVAADAKPVDQTPAGDTPKPAAPTTPVEPTKPVAQPTDEERKAKYQQDRTAAVAKLTEQYVAAIPEDDVAALITEPEKVLPKLLAEVHARAVEQAVDWVQRALPTLLAQHASVERGRSESSAAFFKEWPELNKPEYMPTVARQLSAYRQANPGAKAEEVVSEGGVAALLALRLPIPERVLKKHNADLPDATKPGAFPATPGPGAARVPPAKGDSNVFTVIAEEDLAEQ